MTTLIYRVKLIIAGILNVLCILDLCLIIQKKLYHSNYIRIINYHDTPGNTSENFNKQLIYYCQHYVPVSLADLDSFLGGGSWKRDKPGLIIAFDDGYKSNFSIAAPLLDDHGFIGWFFIPTDYIYAEASESPKRFNGMVTMSWEEVKKLDNNHVIGSHTMTHHRMVVATSPAKMNDEISQSKKTLEEQLKHEISVFCWCGGETHTYNTTAAMCIKQAGYRYAFMTCSAPVLTSTPPLQLQRANVEANWPIALVKFQLCGIMDILYWPKRKKVNRIVNTD
jgi:peptidoglycan/xylan/chitin deacetylase (PgdA/CDA1 family)